MAITNKNLEIRKKKQEQSVLKGLEQEKTLVIKKKRSREEIFKYDHEIVKGLFHFNEVPGGVLQFSFRKYKEDSPMNYSLEDGNVYELPRMVAKHLATSGGYPVHEYQSDTNGRPIVKIGRRRRRYSFESLSFQDDNDVLVANTNLYTVEKY